MGLTIHYTLRWTPPEPLPNDEAVRQFVEEARRRIVRARLGEVTPLRKADGSAFSGLEFAEVEVVRIAEGHTRRRELEVKPDAGWLLTLAPGEDCEPATMGLCRYPEKMWSGGKEWPLPKLRGWRLNLFSKTQYASLHGWEHFRKCHLAVLRALVIWRECGGRVKITDEGDYWPRRSERALRRNLDEMNGAVAGIAGALRDWEEGNGGERGAIQSPVFAHPQFERLEAEGVAKHGKKIAAITGALRK